MSDRDSLWTAVLAKFEELKAGHAEMRGSKRGLMMVDLIDTAKEGVSTIASVGLADGTSCVYWIRAQATPRHGTEVTVERYEDSHDEYWQRQIANDPERRVVVKGCHYRLGKHGEKPTPHNGFAGARFDIVFDDGRRVVTHDLWEQGPIPPKFRSQLPDNARFAGDAS